MNRFSLAAILALLPAAASAQTANGSPTAPASPGLAGTPRPVSRTSPAVGRRRGEEATAGFKTPQAPPPHKETAAERADRLKLEHDLNICTGC